jgi:adenylate cyclase class IV
MGEDNFEIEIKCLLGSKAAADSLLKMMRLKDSKLVKLGVQKQLNHYFEGGNLEDLYQNISSVLSSQVDRDKLKSIARNAKNFSLRTRQTNGKLLLILKISIDDTSSDNGTARMEFEKPIERLTLDKLDKLVLKSGFVYQAKWSREKTDYDYQGTNVTISFSPGYGYLAEFEKIITDPTLATETKNELREQMKELGAKELSQDRLARMFDYYNMNWRDYYGTDKVFKIL